MTSSDRKGSPTRLAARHCQHRHWEPRHRLPHPGSEPCAPGGQPRAGDAHGRGAGPRVPGGTVMDESPDKENEKVGYELGEFYFPETWDILQERETDRVCEDSEDCATLSALLQMKELLKRLDRSPQQLFAVQSV